MFATIELDDLQCRKVTLAYLTRALLIQKQYLSKDQISKYKFIVQEFATLLELEAIAARFDKAWPSDIKWMNE